MEDGPLLRQRRNLISLSFVLLLFTAGGGDIKTLFGVHLQHAWVAIMFAWIGLGYFWWRYWIFGGKTALNQFQIDCHKHITKNKKLLPLVFKMMRSKNPKLVFEGEEPKKFTEAPGQYHNFRISIEVKNPQKDKNPQRTIYFDKDDAKKILRENWIYTAFHGQNFSDFLLPHIFAGTVLSLGIYKLFSTALLPLAMFYWFSR